jgi:ABC-type lipoprotein release transport system permease subunit
MALERGRGRTAVPVGTTLAGAALGLTALVAALSFGANLNHFLDEPRLFGWGWDATVEVSSGDLDEFTSTGRRLDDVDSVTALAPAAHGQVQVDGVSVPAVGIGDGTAADSVLPPLLEGRNPRNPQEVALGTTTLRRIHRDVGDEVTMTVGTTKLRMQVVGRSVFPLFAEYPGSDKTGLGVGATFTTDGLRQLVPRSNLTFYLVDLDDDADRTAALADLRAALPPNDDPESFQVVSEPQRPEDLAGYDRVNATPLVLAGLLAVLALGTTAHGLVIATNRRRRDLAMLKTFGCTRRQLSAVVAWQATTVGLIALAIGVPLGVAAGRRLWILLADRLGTVPEPVTPIVVILVAVPATLVVVNLVAAIPGRRAGAIPTAVALRAE